MCSCLYKHSRELSYQQHYFNNKGRETEDPVSGNQMVTKGYTGRK